MSARGIIETQATTGTWAADSGGIQTDLMQQGVMTRLYATVEITPSLTLTSANQPDGLWRVMKNLSVQRGAHTYFAQPSDDGCMGGALLHDMNVLDRFGPGHFTGSITAPLGRSYIPVTFVWHAGSRPKDGYGRDNPFDLTAFVDYPPGAARATATWQTSGNDVLDDTVTISSAAIRYTLCCVLGNEAEVREMMQLQGVSLPPGIKGMVPAWATRIVSPTATASDYTKTEDFPSGGFIKRVVLLSQDATTIRTLRAIDEVTGVALKLTRAGGHSIQVYTDHFAALQGVATNVEADDGAADFQGQANVGFFAVDMRQLVSAYNPHGKDYGANLTVPGVTGSDYQLGFTITANASGDDILIIFERYLPLYDIPGQPFA